MKIRLRWLVAIAVILGLLLMPAAAQAQPVVPTIYHGSVTIDSIDAPTGTIITAEIEEGEVATNAPDGTAQVGSYELLVVANEGDVVVLKVNYVVGGQATHPDPMSTFEVVLPLSVGEAPPPTLTAEAGGPYYGVVGEEITLSGSASGGTLPYTYAWDLNEDGEYDDATAQNPSYTWSTPGSYTVGLQVKDSASPADTATDTAAVTVSEEAFDPYIYDTDPKDGKLSHDETLAAVNDYLADPKIITKNQALAVVIAYFLSP